jgi:hypothetical protein
MDALVAYGSGSDQSDNDEQQQKQKQSSHEEEGNSREKPGFLPLKIKRLGFIFVHSQQEKTTILNIKLSVMIAVQLIHSLDDLPEF